MEKQGPITVIGSLNVDLVTRTLRIPAAGETLTSESFSIGFGGKGANQAVACARLSSRKRDDHTCTVKMVGMVGDDQFGTSIISSLQSHGIDTDGVSQVPGQNTGVAVIIVDERTGDNRILFSPNANHCWNPDFVRLSEPLPSVIVMQLEIPLQKVLEYLNEAKRKRIDVVLNPAPAIVLPLNAFDGLQHLIMNETEAAILSGSTVDVSDPASLDKVSAEFFSKGVINVVITLGSLGVYFRNQNDAGGHIVPARKVTVVDTTAAGDTFVGAYVNAVASAVGEKFDLRAAVDFASRAASVTVQRHGAQVAIPLRDEVPP